MNYEEKETVLKKFDEYLQKEGKRLQTIRGYLGNTHLFLDWIAEQGFNCLEIRYTDLLVYINHLKEKGNSQQTISGKILGIKHFYNDLQQRELVDYNPCDELRIKGRIKRMPSNLLEWEELEVIYTHYPSANLSGKRNKVMVGLMIYQGLTSGEIERLTIHDIDLEGGKIYVQGILRSNSRVLKLDTVQILPLQKYISQTRKIRRNGQN